MQKSALLEEMFTTFSDSFQNRQSEKILIKNYQKQKQSYKRVFDLCEGEQGRNSLVCARCLISATRSLLYKDFSESDERLYSELLLLKPLFGSSRLKKAELSRFIESRINAVTEMKSDAMTDAVLFMYLSLLPREEREND